MTAKPKPPAAARRGGTVDRKTFLLRLSPDLMAELRSWAGHEYRSLNAHIEYLLRDALRRRKGGGKDEDQ